MAETLEALRRERDEAVLERDEMRAANITSENDGPPLGQSVSYWQDRCLDHATALDRARVEAARRDAAIREWIEDWAPYLSSDVIRSLGKLL